jgi:hypothetical protein
MAMVGLRGAIMGEFASSVAQEAIVALVVFSGVGLVAGWIADYLIRDSLESKFRARVEWYREGLVDEGGEETNRHSNREHGRS